MNIAPWLIVLASICWIAGWASGYKTLRDKIKKGQVIEIEGKVYFSKPQLFMTDEPQLNEFGGIKRQIMPVTPQVKESQG